MISLLIAVVVFFSGTPSAVAADDAPFTQETLIGVWKICYEPDQEGQSGVSEPSFGYLLFMPNGTYYEVREDCCDPPQLMDAPRDYEADGNQVVLSAERYDGTSYERTLTFVGEKMVSFFENGRFGKPVKLPVLAAGSDLNFGWAKAFP